MKPQDHLDYKKENINLIKQYIETLLEIIDILQLQDVISIEHDFYYKIIQPLEKAKVIEKIKFD